MPIKISDSLPARSVLESENIFVITERRAIHQDIRPLKLLILNLMPTKIITETQLMRQLSNTPLQIEVELLRTSSYRSKNTDSDHLASFYTTFNKIKADKYDGMIITGAPVENLEFENVDYWPELCEIMEWTKTNVHSTFHICWGAQAALFYHYQIPKYPLPAKKSGVFSHTVLENNVSLFRGFDSRFNAPHSRFTEILAEDINIHPNLRLLAVSEEAGVFAVISDNDRQIFIMGHLEYDVDTLAAEYFRDINKGMSIDVPKNYFPNDNPEEKPPITWRAHAQLLYSNWLNYYVYQSTPYDLHEL